MIISDTKAATVRLTNSTLLGCGVFSLCLVGILSRPYLDLATLWPANAFMLGMLVRFPQNSHPVTWIACAIGYFAADALTGAEFITNIVLNGGNLLVVATGYHMFAALPSDHRTLKSPSSMLYFMRIILAAAIVAGLTGAIANPFLFDRPWTEGFLFWMASEMVNSAAFLPMILSMPRPQRIDPAAIVRRVLGFPAKKALPLLTLIGSTFAGIAVDGPGALAFPVPALLWCALSYNLFTTACLSFLFTAWTLLAIRTGFIWIGDDLHSRSLLISVRFGVAMIAIAPLVAASVMAARNELVERLRDLAERDPLTGLRNRRSFFDVGTDTLRVSLASNEYAAVMVLDIDHFKSINDRFGHEAGDRVLSEFAKALQKNVRQQDIVGRIGGEEFAIILPNSTISQTVMAAKRLIEKAKFMENTSLDGTGIAITVSIGVCTVKRAGNLRQALALADEALYEAKNSGRDRFVLTRFE